MHRIFFRLYRGSNVTDELLDVRRQSAPRQIVDVQGKRGLWMINCKEAQAVSGRDRVHMHSTDEAATVIFTDQPHGGLNTPAGQRRNRSCVDGLENQINLSAQTLTFLWQNTFQAGKLIQTDDWDV